MKRITCHTNLCDVAVTDTGGPGRPVVLVHGNSLSSESFTHQLGGEPGRRWRLIAFDLPGHGDSPRPADPVRTYRPSGYVEVVRDLVACLGLVRPVVVGHSLGGHIALSAVGDGLDAAGLFLFGTPPVSFPPDLARLFHLDVLGDLFFRGRITESEISAMAALCMPEDVEPPEYYARSIRATDPGARDMLGAAIADGGMVDEQAILDSVGCPTALVLGECDRIVRLDYLRGVQFPMLWRGSAQVIPGAGHCPQYDDPVSFNRLMAGFVDALPL